MLYLIEILHQTTTTAGTCQIGKTLYLIEILHQTTTAYREKSKVNGCILSKFYIKPQHSQCHFVILGVVSYRNSTSNHNVYCRHIHFFELYLIEILHQTTTLDAFSASERRLYLIEILHQTTTLLVMSLPAAWLYLIEILHQTTTTHLLRVLPFRLYLIEILHQTTTSPTMTLKPFLLYLIEILHQTTTMLLL